MSDKHLYAAFEAQHRGSRELITQRLSIYLPFVLPLHTLYPESHAIDIGCGRGEWLELLQKHHIDALGIDQDEGMLLECQKLNLNVQLADALEVIQKQKDESVTIVSAFHVVEHISFESLQTLIKEAYRILKPGGLLILETPNPENIRVSTERFYLDPTHIKPIPFGFLSFLPEYFGFIRTKIIRLQEDTAVMQKASITLLDVMQEVSPDYAVIAQKSASSEVLRIFDTPFNKKFGYSLELLSAKFEERLRTMENKIQHYKKQNEMLQTLVDKEINTHQNSLSWKITKPLRFSVRAVKWSIRQPMKYISRNLAKLQYRIYTTPKLKKSIKYLINKSSLFEKILNLMLHYKTHQQKSISIPKTTRLYLTSIKKKVEKRKEKYHATR